jgi:uncharacterized protein YjbI with pentapeptide repeats
MKKDFSNWKQTIVDKCKAAGACQPEFDKLLAAENDGEVWAVLLANKSWCFDNLIFSGKDTAGITLPQSVGGWLDLRGCDLNGITLPQSVGGWLDLRGCDLNGITLPQSVGGGLNLRGCVIPDGLDLSKYEVIY